MRYFIVLITMLMKDSSRLSDVQSTARVRIFERLKPFPGN